MIRFCSRIFEASCFSTLRLLAVFLFMLLAMVLAGCQSPAGMGVVSIQNRDDVPFQGSLFVNSVRSSWCQSSLLFNRARFRANVQLCGLMNLTDHNNVQISTILNIADDSDFQFCALPNIVDKGGTQIGCLVNWSENCRVQLLGPIANYSKRRTNFQLGVIWNYSRIPDAQVGAILNWGHTAGFQMSIANVARNVISQVGLYNHATQANFQLGLVNINKNGWLPWTFLINFYLPPDTTTDVPTWEELEALDSQW